MKRKSHELQPSNRNDRHYSVDEINAWREHGGPPPEVQRRVDAWLQDPTAPLPVPHEDVLAWFASLPEPPPGSKEKTAALITHAVDTVVDELRAAAAKHPASSLAELSRTLVAQPAGNAHSLDAPPDVNR